MDALLPFLISILFFSHAGVPNCVASGAELRILKIDSKSIPTFNSQQTKEAYDVIELDASKIEDLQILGMVWGYLKYYHPNVARGDFDWDLELVHILPLILETETIEERDVMLLKWILNLGDFKTNRKANIKNRNIKLKPDLKWIKEANLSLELETVLIQLKGIPKVDSNVYVSLKEKNPKFINEDPYTSMKYPDMNYRLLSLFRYWNIIKYYFPYKHLIEDNWDLVLAKFIPIFINAANEKEYTLAVLKLINRVHDTHANIWGFNLNLEIFKGLYASPLRLKYVENKFVVIGYHNDSLAKSTELMIGDVITKVNGISVDTILKNRLDITPASNLPTKLRDIALNLLRTNNSKIEIEFERDGSIYIKREATFSVGTLNIFNFSNRTECFKRINESITYLYLGSIKNEFLDSLWQEIKGTKGLIIDLRCYPSDFVTFSLGKYLMPNSRKFVKFTQGSITCPGLFSFNSPLIVGEKNPDFYKGQVILLVDEYTQSNAEYTAMAFSVAPNVTIIGSTTAGADGNVSWIYLPGNIFTMISGIGVYYPNGKETQRIGIVPDIFIRPSLQGIKQGRDELIEKAIEIINK